MLAVGDHPCGEFSGEKHHDGLSLDHLTTFLLSLDDYIQPNQEDIWCWCHWSHESIAGKTIVVPHAPHNSLQTQDASDHATQGNKATKTQCTKSKVHAYVFHLTQ